MIYTFIYTLETDCYQWDVAHLFEHLVINDFFEAVSEHGINPALIGWIRADTFEDRIFIDCGFYQSEVANLFQEYIDDLPLFSEENISIGLKVMEAEDKVAVAILDKQMLNKNIFELSQIRWNADEQKAAVGSKSELLQSRRAASKFRDITIGVYAEDLTKNEQILFLRFEVLLADIVIHMLRTNFHVYSRGSSPVQKQDTIMGALIVFTLAKRPTILKDIKTLLELSIHNFDVRQNWAAVNAHFKGFSSNELWKDFAVYYYRWTGINTTTDEIASFATQENISSVLHKIKFVVRASDADDYNNF